MRRSPRASESAISQVAGMTIFLFLTMVISGSAYAWIRSVEPPMHGPTHSVIFAGSPVVVDEDGMRKGFSVQMASIGTRWWNVQFQLDGALVKCDETQGAADSWRVVWYGHVLPCNGPRGAPDHPIAAGQTFEVWDAGADAHAPLAARTLTIVDPETNSLVQRVRMG